MAEQRDSHGVDDRRRPETVNNPRNFWRTTGCATVLAATVAASATLLAQQIGKKDPVTAPVTGGSISSAAPSSGLLSAEAPATPVASVAPESLDSGAVRWQGKFAMTSYVDFNSIPPRGGSGGSLAQDVYGKMHTRGGGALWTEERLPTKQECSDMVDTQSVELISPAPGVQVCYKNSADLVVYFKFLGNGEQQGSSYRYQTQLTVWN